MTPEPSTNQPVAVPQPQDLDPQDIIGIVDSHGGERSSLIAVLGDVQAKYRYLPQDALRIVADRIGIALVDVYAAATFYHSFSLKPKGKHIVLCCLGTACHVRGGSGIAEELERALGIGPGETTEDKQFSLEAVNCLGACALGPVVVVDGRYFSKVRKPQIRQILDGALAGFEDADPAQDERVFPLQVNCPNCGHSLMDADNPLCGSPSIRLMASANSKRGWVRLCGLYGVTAAKWQHLVPKGAGVEYFCPHCRASFTGTDRCPECKAPMAQMAVAGGTLMVCLSNGCPGKMLDLYPSSAGPSSSRLGKKLREVSSRRG